MGSNTKDPIGPKVGRARRRVASFGVADMGNPIVREAVKAKYPERTHPMPDSVLEGTCLERVPCPLLVT